MSTVRGEPQYPAGGQELVIAARGGLIQPPTPKKGGPEPQTP